MLENSRNAAKELVVPAYQVTAIEIRQLQDFLAKSVARSFYSQPTKL
jgi:hypothetical protein